MPKNRILPAIGVAALIPLSVWAQAPSAPATTPPAGSVQAAQAAAANEPPTEAEKALDEAVKKLAALKSVAADLTEKVDMLDQRFTIQGRYLKAPGNRIFLHLKVAGLPDATGQMLQVCDGKTLWDYKQVLESQTYTKFEIAQIVEKLKAPELDETIRDAVTSQFGFGGPDELLRGLRKAVKFDQKSEDTLDGKPVWVLRGEWRNRDGLMGPNQQPLPATIPLPAYVPSLVIVWVGKDDGWPYKVRLTGRRPSVLADNRKVGPNGRPIGPPKSTQEVKPTDVELVYSDVKLNPELKIDEFVFSPPQNASVEDQTPAVVGMLDQAIAYRAAAKKAEAAKGEDPLLNQSIDVPKIGAPATPAPAPAANPAASPAGAPR